MAQREDWCTTKLDGWEAGWMVRLREDCSLPRDSRRMENCRGLSRDLSASTSLSMTWSRWWYEVWLGSKAILQHLGSMNRGTAWQSREGIVPLCVAHNRRYLDAVLDPSTGVQKETGKKINRFLVMRMRQWNRSPQKAVPSSSLECFKLQLVQALSSLVWPLSQPCFRKREASLQVCSGQKGDERNSEAVLAKPPLLGQSNMDGTSAAVSSHLC